MLFLVVTCDQAPSICGIDARCVVITDKNRSECVCTGDGFSGDGDDDDVTLGGQVERSHL